MNMLHIIIYFVLTDILMLAIFLGIMTRFRDIEDSIDEKAAYIGKSFEKIYELLVEIEDEQNRQRIVPNEIEMEIKRLSDYL